MHLPLPTLGGAQLWTDRRISHGWRIQQNVLTGHHRLLDPRNLRRAWGSFETCASTLAANIPPTTTDPSVAAAEAVVVLHGLGRTRRAMQPLADHLADHGYHVLNFGYASTRATVDDHARALAEVVTGVEADPRVHFVGHSLGNLIVRRLLAMRQRGQAPTAPPIGRVVMLAPPNAGSQVARRLRSNPAFILGMGPAGQEIAQWETLAENLAIPDDFGIIAGRLEMPGHPLLDEAGDLVVSVEETKLPGANDFREIDATHTFLMRRREVMQWTRQFLETGRFGERPGFVESRRMRSS